MRCKACNKLLTGAALRLDRDLCPKCFGAGNVTTDVVRSEHAARIRRCAEGRTLPAPSSDRAPARRGEEALDYLCDP